MLHKISTKFFDQIRLMITKGSKWSENKLEKYKIELKNKNKFSKLDAVIILRKS